jgi:hypothetical protein
MTPIVDLRQDVWHRRDRPLLDSAVSSESLSPHQPTRRYCPIGQYRTEMIVRDVAGSLLALGLGAGQWRAPPERACAIKSSASPMRVEPLATAAATYRRNGPDMTQLRRGTHGA